MKERIKDGVLEKSLISLKESVDALDGNMRKEVSFRRSFLLSIVRGIGYTLGATIVASIVVFILAYIVSYVQYVPFLRDHLNPDVVTRIFGTGEGSGGGR